MEETLKFRHILFLHMMSLLQEPPNQGMLPSQFFESAYNWIGESGVTPNYTRRFKKNMKFYQESCEMLFRLGLIEPVERKNKGYVLTASGERFLKSVGEDWRNWPLFVEVSSTGTADLKNAIYAQERATA
jgi:hypothetical protein